MASTWHKLPSQAESLPSLLTSYTWTLEGYELYLTDLTSIWSEQLSRKEIFERAEQGITTIDPSEGDDQLELLLTKVGEALSGAGSKLSLTSGSKVDSININISAKLPSPLKPFKWTLQSSKEPTSSLTNRILLPLLKDEAAWESRQQALTNQLQQKDWVLDKLFDRIETLGVDMSTIFPSASGIRSSRKGDTRSELGKLVKGVAPFDEKAWLAQQGSSSSTFNLASNLVHEVFGSDFNKGPVSFNPVRDHWWDGLDTFSNAFQEEDDLAPEEEEAPNSLTEESKEHPEPGLDDGNETTGTTDSEFEVRGPLTLYLFLYSHDPAIRKTTARESPNQEHKKLFTTPKPKPKETQSHQRAVRYRQYITNTQIRLRIRIRTQTTPRSTHQSTKQIPRPKTYSKTTKKDNRQTRCNRGQEKLEATTGTATTFSIRGPNSNSRTRELDQRWRIRSRDRASTIAS